MNVDMELGHKLRYLRQLQNITQKDLAERIGVTKNVLSNWESGRTKMNAEYLVALSHELNVTIEEILNFDDYSNVFPEKKEKVSIKREPKNKTFVRDSYLNFLLGTSDLIENFDGIINESMSSIEIKGKILDSIDPDGIIEKYYALSQHSQDLIHLIVDYELGEFTYEQVLDKIIYNFDNSNSTEPELIAAHGSEGMSESELEKAHKDADKLTKALEKQND